MARTFLILAAVFGFLGVALGAFGAHGLAATFAANPDNEATYHTAAQYQMYHALALLGVGILYAQNTTTSQHRFLKFAGWLFVTGILLFSGSLYILSVFNLRFMGAIAPLGGAAMLGGWLCLGLTFRKVAE